MSTLYVRECPECLQSPVQSAQRRVCLYVCLHLYITYFFFFFFFFYMLMSYVCFALWYMLCWCLLIWECRECSRNAYVSERERWERGCSRGTCEWERHSRAVSREKESVHIIIICLIIEEVSVLVLRKNCSMRAYLFKNATREGQTYYLLLLYILLYYVYICSYVHMPYMSAHICGRGVYAVQEAADWTRCGDDMFARWCGARARRGAENSLPWYHAKTRGVRIEQRFLSMY